MEGTSQSVSFGNEAMTNQMVYLQNIGWVYLIGMGGMTNLNNQLFYMANYV